MPLPLRILKLFAPGNLSALRIVSLLLFAAASAVAETLPANEALFFRKFANPGLEFSRANETISIAFSNKLDGVKSVTIGGWFFLRLRGEQYLFHRGLPEIGPNGDRLFRRQENWVNFLLGTDQRGFLLGVINGNSYMPFPLVTVSEVGFDEWSQLVVVKTASGHHKLYHNDTLVFSDIHSASTGKNAP